MRAKRCAESSGGCVEQPDLERIVGDALTALPPPQAPASLLPRIMAAVGRSAERAWYLRGWLRWPLGWQTASVAAFLVVGAALFAMLPPVWQQVGNSVVAPAAETVGRFEQTLRMASVLASTVLTICRAVAEPLVKYAVVLLVAMGMICAALGAAVNRVALGGAARS